MSDKRQEQRKSIREWESIVEKAIREAQERGEFDNLPGLGKPIHWDDDHVPPEWRMAHRILKNAGLAPMWIEDDKRIRKERKALRELLERFEAWYREEVTALVHLAPSQASERLEELEAARRVRMATYRQRAAALNKEIDRFNLIVPIVRLQWPRIRIEEELRRFQARLDEIRTQSIQDAESSQ